MRAKILRTVSLVMLSIGIVYLAYAFTHPEFGTVFYIGSLAIGSTIWRIFYCVYATVTLALYISSIFLKRKSH